jgi:hypothetical protein
MARPKTGQRPPYSVRLAPETDDKIKALVTGDCTASVVIRSFFDDCFDEWRRPVNNVSRIEPRVVRDKKTTEVNPYGNDQIAKLRFKNKLDQCQYETARYIQELFFQTRSRIRAIDPTRPLVGEGGNRNYSITDSRKNASDLLQCFRDKLGYQTFWIFEAILTHQRYVKASQIRGLCKILDDLAPLCGFATQSLAA